MWITIMIFKQWFCYSVPYFWWLLYLVSDSFLCFPSVNFRSQTNLPWGSWRGFEFSQLNSLLSWASLHETAIEIQLLSTLTIQCRGKFRNFQLTLAMHQQKTVKTQQKLLYITSTMASAYLNILLKTMIWFFKSCEKFLKVILPILYIILFTYNTLEWVKRKTIFLSLITLFWFLWVSLL